MNMASKKKKKTAKKKAASSKKKCTVCRKPGHNARSHEKGSTRFYEVL